MAHRSDRRGDEPITRMAAQAGQSIGSPRADFHDGPEPVGSTRRGRRYVCSLTIRWRRLDARLRTATALRARQGPAAAFGGALRATLTRARAAA